MLLVELPKSVQFSEIQPLAKISRELAEKVAEARTEKADPVLVLNLEKLKGQLPSTKELASLVQYSLLSNQVLKPRWLYFKNLKGYLQVVLLRINCLEKHIVIFNLFNIGWVKLVNRSRNNYVLTH